MNRRDKTNYYLDMAQVALERGTCLRRNFGAVIVKNDVIVSTGYTGAPRGRANCIDIGTCVRHTMCKRMIITAGISHVVIRRDNDTYDTIDVADWVAHDDVLDGQTGY